MMLSAEVRISIVMGQVLKSPAQQSLKTHLDFILQCVLQLFTFLWSECVQTCYDLPEFGVQVDSAGQKHLHVAGSQNGHPGREEDLEAANVPVNLQQRLHILGGGNIFGYPSWCKKRTEERFSRGQRDKRQIFCFKVGK